MTTIFIVTLHWSSGRYDVTLDFIFIASRFSELASARLRDNNPNVADLSDQYRPTKLTEMFSELYDNQWTEAYTALEGNISDSYIIAFLLDVVMASTLSTCYHCFLECLL